MGTTSTSTPKIPIDTFLPLDPPLVSEHVQRGFLAVTRPIRPTLEVTEKYRQFLECAWKGEWEDAEKILNEDGEAMTAKVMTLVDESITALDVVVMEAQDQLVENLVERFPQICEVSIFRRALKNAARRGRMRMVKALVDKVNAEPESVDLAMRTAISWDPMQKEVIEYLARRTTSAPSYGTMSCLIMAGHLDIALSLTDRFDGLAASRDTKNRSLLGDLAKMKCYFRSGARLNIWGKFFYNCIPICLVDTPFDNSKDTKIAPALKRFKMSLWNLTMKSAPYIKIIGESKLRHKESHEFAKRALIEMETRMNTLEIFDFLLASGIVIDAASRGISEIVKLCLDHCPALRWDKNFPKELMQEVVNRRHVELFRLMKEHNIIPYLTDNMLTNYDLMEAVVKWSPQCVPADISGAAFVMQRELQWYKVLEDRSDPYLKSLEFKILEDGCDPSYKSLELVEAEEGRGKSYREVFVEQRRDLLKEAGQWMKDTSSSCSVIATLIITVAFAAAFTVPGGNDGSIGIPIFLKNGSFMVFAIADTLALFSSVTATMMFMAILTSRYTIEDFLHSLPQKMILGLTFLFLSLAFMLVAFGSALTIVLSERLKWIYIPITLLAAFPVVLFIKLQFPLYVEMVESTYWPCLYHP